MAARLLLPALGCRRGRRLACTARPDRAPHGRRARARRPRRREPPPPAASVLGRRRPAARGPPTSARAAEAASDGGAEPPACPSSPDRPRRPLHQHLLRCRAPTAEPGSRRCPRLGLPSCVRARAAARRGARPVRAHMWPAVLDARQAASASRMAAVRRRRAPVSRRDPGVLAVARDPSARSTNLKASGHDERIPARRSST